VLCRQPRTVQTSCCCCCSWSELFLAAYKTHVAFSTMQLVRMDTDLLEAKAQCVKLQEDFRVKCEELTAEKQEKAALQKARRASDKANIYSSQTSRYPHTPLPSPHPKHPGPLPPPQAPWPPSPTPSTLAAVVLSQGVLLWLILASVASLSPLQVKCCSMTFHPKLHW